MKSNFWIKISDADDRCGIFIASSLLINRIRIHEQFDVVLVVRLLRRMRLNMISTLVFLHWFVRFAFIFNLKSFFKDAYKFLYSSSVQFMDKLDMFINPPPKAQSSYENTDNLDNWKYKLEN